MVATTEINLKNIIVNIRSQTQKAIYCMIPFKWNIQIRQSIAIEIRLVVIRNWERGKQGMTVNVCRVSFWSDENVLRVLVVAQLCEHIDTESH